MSTAPLAPLSTPVKMLMRAIDDKDWGVVEALLHPHTEYEVSGFLPFRGREAVMNYYRLVRPIQKGEHLIERMIFEGDHVALWGRFNAMRTDNVEVSLLFADVMIFENKKVKKRRVYYCEPKAPA